MYATFTHSWESKSLNTFFQHLSQNYSVVQLLGETNARFPKEQMHHLAKELQLSGSVPPGLPVPPDLAS